MTENQKIFKIALDSLLEGSKKTMPWINENERMAVLSIVYLEQFRDYAGFREYPGSLKYAAANFLKECLS